MKTPTCWTILISFLWVASIGGVIAPDAEASGTISGRIADSRTGSALQGVTVYFLEAINAVIETTAVTDANGSYQSAPLAAGYYRVRFSSVIVSGTSYPPAYYGANGEDLWELGSIVQVTDGTNLDVSITLNSSSPSQTIECGAMIAGMVTDGTGVPLAGIEVSARNALNAMPIVVSGVPATALTDSSGKYNLRTGGVCVSDKIRFADPSGSFLSEYAGAGGTDDFSLAAALTRSGFDERPRELNESLARVTPDQAIQNVMDLVTDLGFSNDLAGGLDQGIAIVQDANPNNDTAACGILEAFINRVNNRLKRGELTQAEATALVQNATAAKSAIGCR